ncbi:hypothetical protein HPB50_014017 [Hyalomma asiaticum]|uniref:Uncharacterized protein n=1 Tax=Hyalomma asiaticum TaxID=266040 RepID=A0ACB7SHN5_HYAAI|nr:hypothetical protein HPB50_014017 [Hyalomma asiaticum]
MMSWWQLRAMPKPVLAFLPAVALPLFGIMGHEQIAANYLSVDVLTTLLLLCLVLVSDETPTVGRLSYALVSRFGGRARPVLVLLTALTFVASLVLPQSLVAVFVTCLVERLCNFVREEGLQDAQRCLDRAVADDTAGHPCDVDTLMLYEELAVALWKRHRVGLDDQDSIECWDNDRRGNESPEVKRVGLLKRKMSILKPSKSAATQDGAGACTPSGTRFADVPPDKDSASADEAKQPEGKLIRAKRRRQSFADKPHVFEYSERRRVTHDMPPLGGSLQEEPNSSRTSNASPRFTPSQQSAGSQRASFAKTPPSMTMTGTNSGIGALAPRTKFFGRGNAVSLQSASKAVDGATGGSGVGFAKGASSYETATQVSFFAFPKDPLLKKRWLVAIKRDEGKLFAVTKHTKVCSTHFASDDYLPNVVGGRRYLRVDAVPSVFAFGKPQRPARRKPRDRQQCVSRARRLSAIGQAGSSELALGTTLSPGGDVAVSRDCATADEVLDATECSDSASAPTSATDFQERQEVCGRTCAATVVNLEEQLSEHQANWKAI